MVVGGGSHSECVVEALLLAARHGCRGDALKRGFTDDRSETLLPRHTGKFACKTQGQKCKTNASTDCSSRDDDMMQ